MKQARRSLIVVGALFVLFMMQQFGMLESILNNLERVAWWVYLVVAGIIFSGYQAFNLSKQEREVDDEWIEQQGNVYMKRINAEKKRRQDLKNPKTMQ
ncbi:sporulation YhaL family protein [Sporolactobacillus mangiferae]|uniref:sporulation YhaL family protein n=1 Tax=Sporolactobacillus mangiferae TaxID=2940498 RepID=UPI003F61024D